MRASKGNSCNTCEHWAGRRDEDVCAAIRKPIPRLPVAIAAPAIHAAGGKSTHVHKASAKLRDARHDGGGRHGGHARASVCAVVADAQLAGAVVPPTIRGATRGECTCVAAPCSKGNDACEDGRHWRREHVYEVTRAQLAVVVPAPAIHRVICHNNTRMTLPTRDDCHAAYAAH